MVTSLRNNIIKVKQQISFWNKNIYFEIIIDVNY